MEHLVGMVITGVGEGFGEVPHRSAVRGQTIAGSWTRKTKRHAWEGGGMIISHNLVGGAERQRKGTTKNVRER